MNVDGFYFWHCDVCNQSKPETPFEDDPQGWGNLLLVQSKNGQTMTVCRDCIEALADLEDDWMRGQGVGFLMGGVYYTGPKAKAWANQIIDGILDSSYDFPEYECGHWIWQPEDEVD